VGGRVGGRGWVWVWVWVWVGDPSSPQARAGAGACAAASMKGCVGRWVGAQVRVRVWMRARRREHARSARSPRPRPARKAAGRGCAAAPSPGGGLSGPPPCEAAAVSLRATASGRFSPCGAACPCRPRLLSGGRDARVPPCLRAAGPRCGCAIHCMGDGRTETASRILELSIGIHLWRTRMARDAYRCSREKGGGGDLLA
jgi:hypothetical protein